MKLGTILGCSLAMLVGGAAVLVSGAEALPAFYECSKVPTGMGEYANKDCTTIAEPGKGKYELEEGVGKGRSFAGKIGSVTFHVPASGLEIDCSSGKVRGEVTSPTRESAVVLTFSGCTTLSKPCSSAGGVKGEIETNPLIGDLGYISKAGTEVGVDLKAESGTAMAEWTCEGLSFQVTGSLIARQQGDINKFSKASTNVFAVNGEGIQEVKKFEGGAEDVPLTSINGEAPEPSGIQTTASLKGEELEIKA